MDDFAKPKIAYREIGTQMDACLIPAGWMINNKLFIITGNHLTHIMHFLNSHLFNRIIFQTANFGGGKGVDWLQGIKAPLPEECDLQDEADADLRLSDFYGLDKEERAFIGVQ